MLLQINENLELGDSWMSDISERLYCYLHNPDNSLSSEQFLMLYVTIYIHGIFCSYHILHM